ncbi:MAG: N-acetylmuramoyl-L-alanine amidase-like domain-containing protein [Candidatus Kapaibacterium sp.]
MNCRDFLKRTSLATLGALAIPALIPGAGMARRLPRDADPKNFTGQAAFTKITKLAEEGKWKSLPIGELIGKIALEMRGTPYVGATLELFEDHEVCSVNLLGLDCVTFFESALGMARSIKRGTATPAALMAQVTYTRYRGGRMTDYTSRLHYTSDWFYDNEAKHVVRNITRELPGAVRFTNPVNFMSTHPDAYKQLKANPKMVPVIAEVERTINSRNMYYVPKDKVRAIEPKLQTGDIIGITTTINGIDCSHTGLCYRDDAGLLRFLHASLTKKQVTLDDELSVYLASVSKHTGIMVVRPVEA